jgi:regulatory protein
VRRPRPDRASNSAADERTVRTAALKLLAGRDFGRRELLARLGRKGYPAAVSGTVVDQLASERLLSEGRFVSQFIRQHAGRGHGPVRIRLELRERGIEPAAIDAALDEAGEDWVESARLARRRKFGAGLPAGFRERAKQARFLQYRGFSADQVRAALGPGDESD